MAILTVSGAPATRFEEVAHGAAQLLGFALVTETRLDQWLAEEFGEIVLPTRAWRHAALSVLARMAAREHLVIAVGGAEAIFPAADVVVRGAVVAADARRIGNVMLARGMEREEARAELARLDADAKQIRKARFGRSAAAAQSFDVVVNAARMEPPQMAEVFRAAVCAQGAPESLSAADEAQMQFDSRLKLARYGIVPAERAHLKEIVFGHPSEELFANLLDFYRIEWVYEPRSFALQWDKDGQVTEAFTPDFYLPEFDLYVELTTMKQAHVTRKNRKVKLLRAIYPHVNIRVFYQRDYQDLVFKYGLRSGLGDL